jgi:hypothetical protein
MIPPLLPCSCFSQVQAFMVQVPPGLMPGQTFHANIGGRLVAVQVPPGVSPGQALQIQVPVMMQRPPAAPPTRPVMQQIQMQQMQRQVQQMPQVPQRRVEQQKPPHEMTMNEQAAAKREAELAAKERVEKAVRYAPPLPLPPPPAPLLPQSSRAHTRDPRTVRGLSHTPGLCLPPPAGEAGEGTRGGSQGG